MSKFSNGFVLGMQHVRQLGLVERGMAQGMRDSLLVSGSGTYGALSHTRHYSPTQKFFRSKVVFATTYPAGTQLQDTDLPDLLYIQCALEPTWQGGASGLVKRTYLYTFGGAKYATYNGPGTNPRKFLESDWLYHPEIKPGAANKFGLWTYVERQSGAGALPSSDLGSSYVDRGEGYQTFTAGSTPSGPQLANDPVLNMTAIAAMSSTQIGSSSSLTPAFMVIEYDNTVTVVGISGDSICQYVGEGYAGSPSTSDSLGSANRNCGYPVRGVVETLGISPAINIARASDGTKYTAAPGGNNGRLARLRRANPTHMFVEENVNDLSGTGLIGTLVAWAANTFYSLNDVRYSGSNIYMATRGGISSSTAPTHTSGTAADGQVIWRFLGTGTNASREYAVYGMTARVIDKYRSAVPGVKICKAFTTPQSTSTDSFATLANQTATWAPPSVRSLYHALLMADRTAGDKTLGDTWFEPSLGTYNSNKIEYGYDGTTANMSSKWYADGATANLLTTDGTHPNSVGHAAIASAFSSGLFA